MTPLRTTSKRGSQPLFDRLLASRLETYLSLNEGSSNDPDAAVEYLRNKFREYQRHKVAPFRCQISRLLEAMAPIDPSSNADADMEEDLADQGLHIQKEEKSQEDAQKEPKLGGGSTMNKVLTSMYTPTGKGVDDDANGDKAEASRPKRQRITRQRASNVSRSSSVTAPFAVTYAELGGIEGVLEDVKELVEYPLKHPEVYQWLGVDPPRGILLHGPPGCGKTALANAIANECNVPFLRIAAPEVVSGMSGESEAKVRQLFQEATSLAPCIVFIDEIDAIAPKRESAQREMERRIVAQLLTCLDDLSSLKSAPQPPDSGIAMTDNDPSQDGADVTHGDQPSASRHVVIIGATNRPDSLDPALRRAGRFDREIGLGIPSESGRESILRVLTKKLRLSGDFDFKSVARRTPGFVGADLSALMKESAALAVKRIFAHMESVLRPPEENKTGCQPEELVSAQKPTLPGRLSLEQLKQLAITMDDVDRAITKVQPSVRREGFATTPDVTWDDVGSLGDVREELAFAITEPISRPELFESMGLRNATGVLLFGPPGCGKTLVAKAAANESGANFISIKGPELLNKYVGESERAVRQVFSRARAAAPCVLFFDELDALAPRRGGDTANASAERVVNQLLTEMDGIEGRQGVYLVAATNRPDMIDPALLRPGRLDKILYVPLPPPEGRASILRALARRSPISPEVDLDALGMSRKLTGFSGADIAALLREACVAALKEKLNGSESVVEGNQLVGSRHFAQALLKVQPSVSKSDQIMYDALRLRLRSSRGHLRREGGDMSPMSGDEG